MRDKMLDLTKIPFKQALNYTRAQRARESIKWIVLHSMEGPEEATRAEHVARWMSGELAPKFPAPRTSAHYAVDSDSIVQMVRDRDVAWHAPGANKFGIGIEHAGKAKQTREQWLDAFSGPMLLMSAELSAALCNLYVIPRVFVDASDLLKGEAGITTHAEVTKAFKRGTHIDPGPTFPMDWYLDRVAELAALPRG